MAKDEGNGGSGGQNLVRFRPDLSDAMSLPLRPADDNGRGCRGGEDTRCLFLPRGVVSATCREPIFAASAAKIWPPLAVKPFVPIRPDETSCGSKRGQPATRENPRAQQGAREPRPAVSIPLVKPSSGLRRARRRRRRGFAGGRLAHHLFGGDLPCRGLPDDFFRR